MQRMRRTPDCQRASRGILRNSLLTALFVITSVVSPAAGYAMEIYQGMTLNTSVVTAVQLDAPSVCYCRMYCMAQLNCTSVTVKAVNSTYTSPVDCFFSGHIFPMTSLEPQNTSFTFAKLGCVAPFTLIDDVGCLNLVWGLVTFAEAQNACAAMNAFLYDSPSQQNFDSFRNYLVRTKLVGDFWLGFKNRKWIRSGRVPNAGEWSLGEPNEDPSVCGRVNQQEDFKLRDKDCTYKFSFICQNAWV
ncbi:uncharacterized protein [Macrobrachium rosenbergii]|uniref:uncharacterized protein n=1 Tax=Macrobrachium rosenbergii TaxID=79674 RepID=UPI0034D595E1